MQICNYFNNGFYIFDLDEYTILLINNNSWNTANRCDNRNGTIAHAFNKRHGKSFKEGWHYKKVKTLQKIILHFSTYKSAILKLSTKHCVKPKYVLSFNFFCSTLLRIFL